MLFTIAPCKLLPKNGAYESTYRSGRLLITLALIPMGSPPVLPSIGDSGILNMCRYFGLGGNTTLHFHWYPAEETQIIYFIALCAIDIVFSNVCQVTHKNMSRSVRYPIRICISIHVITVFNYCIRVIIYDIPFGFS